MSSPRLAQAAGHFRPRCSLRRRLGAAVPTILSGLAGLAAKPDGARQLADTVARQPADMLDKLGEHDRRNRPGRRHRQEHALLRFSAAACSPALPAASPGSSVSMRAAMRSLLGMLTPAVLGVLGREAGSEPGALTQLLSSQKDAFAAAMPAGLSDYLKPASDRGGSCWRARSASLSRSRERGSTPQPIAIGAQPDELQLGLLGRAARCHSAPLRCISSAAIGPRIRPRRCVAGREDRRPRERLPSRVADGRIGESRVAEGDLQNRIATAVGNLTQTLQGRPRCRLPRRGAAQSCSRPRASSIGSRTSPAASLPRPARGSPTPSSPATGKRDAFDRNRQ